MQDTLMMDEVMPRLAEAIRSVLADAQIQVLEHGKIEVRFDGIPTWKISVLRQLVNREYQIIETQIDLLPLCLASMSSDELQRLAATENAGLRGVTILPIQPETNDGRGGLRVRASFAGQKGRTIDEVENLAIDILTVLSFARTLEDRVTDNAIAGDFSFELYNSRFESSTRAQPVRFITTNQSIFEGNHQSVFAEITRILKNEFSFEVRDFDAHSALVRAKGSHLDVAVKIPNDIPIFVAHASLAKLEDLTPTEVWTLLEELNSQVESGHFEYDPSDMMLSFTAWKHLTNDLRHFSFDQVIASVNRAAQKVPGTFLKVPGTFLSAGNRE